MPPEKPSTKHIPSFFWCVFFIMVPLHFLISDSLGPTENLVQGDDPILKLKILVVLSFLSIWVSWVLPKKMWASGTPRLTDLATDLERINAFFTGYFVRLMAIEALSIFGFILRISGSAAINSLIFFASALIGLLLNFPTQDYIRKALGISTLRN